MLPKTGLSPIGIIGSLGINEHCIILMHKLNDIQGLRFS
jgi:hypothetical protein